MYVYDDEDEDEDEDDDDDDDDDFRLVFYQGICFFLGGGGGGEGGCMRRLFQVRGLLLDVHDRISLYTSRFPHRSRSFDDRVQTGASGRSVECGVERQLQHLQSLRHSFFHQHMTALRGSGRTSPPPSCMI